MADFKKTRHILQNIQDRTVFITQDITNGISHAALGIAQDNGHHVLWWLY